MGLKVELKAGERIVIGECVVTNAGQRTRLLIEGQAPILREKDIITVEQADTPAKRLYLCVLLMYTSRDPVPLHPTYFSLVRDILQAASSTRTQIEIISNYILIGDMYKALKQTKQLITYEQELLENEKRRTSLRQCSEANFESA